MKLTRRDALAALAATGIVGSGAVYIAEDDESSGPSSEQGQSGDSSTSTVETAAALAPVVFPSEVTEPDEFVRTYVIGRLENDEAYRSGIIDATEALDGHANEEYDAAFRDLSTTQREELLVSIGLNRVQPDPDGSDLSKIRFYLINELLYGLFSSPTGGELVGTPNPPGHPGGLEAYQGEASNE
jgi:hypothetical protein